jgi:hypothetical protein
MGELDLFKGSVVWVLWRLAQIWCFCDSGASWIVLVSAADMFAALHLSGHAVSSQYWHPHSRFAPPLGHLVGAVVDHLLKLRM